MKKILIEIPVLNDGITNEAAMVVGGMFKTRILEIYKNHPSYKEWLSSKIKVNIVDEKEVETLSVPA